MEQSFTLINWSSLVDIIKALMAIGAGGGVMSLVVSALVGANWPAQAKGLVAFLMCLVGAFVPIAVAGVELTNLALVVPLMWIGSQTFYRLWFKPLASRTCWRRSLPWGSVSPASTGRGELAGTRRFVTRFEGRAFNQAALGSDPDRTALP